MNENKSKYEVDVRQIMEMLLKRWWIVVITVIIAIAGAFAYTHFLVTPTYVSSATMLINGGSNMTSYQQILAGQYQLKDYPFILKSHDTLGLVAERLNADENVTFRENYNSSILYGMVSYQSEDNSRIFKITVTSDNPEEAQIIVKMVAEVFEDMTEKITDAEVQTVETPRLPTSATSSGLKKNIVLGAAAGVVIGVVIAVFLGLSSDVLDSEEWLLKHFKEEAPLLASIPDSSHVGGRGYYRYQYKKYYKYSSDSDSNKASE